MPVTYDIDPEAARAVLSKVRSDNREAYDRDLDEFVESGQEFGRVSVKEYDENKTPSWLANGLNSRAAKRELPVEAKSFGDKETVLLHRVEQPPAPRQRKGRNTASE